MRSDFSSVDFAPKACFDWVSMVLLPLWLLAFLTVIGIRPVDMILARVLYLGGGEWLAGHGFVAETLIHHCGKLIPAAVCLGCAALWIIAASGRSRRLAPAKGAFAYVAVSILACTAAVVIGKTLSGTPCPWSLPVFGGSGATRGGCYPAGHAGAAFSLFCLYFACRRFAPRFAPGALAAVLVLGAVFGVSRQMQGAHFLSHTLATAALDWAMCAAIYRLTIGRAEKSVFTACPKGSAEFCAAVSFYWAAVLNLPVLCRAAGFAGATGVESFLFASEVFLMLWSAFFAALEIISLPSAFFGRIIAALLSIAGAAAFYFNTKMGTVVNADMARNVLSTDPAEAAEVLTSSAVLSIALISAPAVRLAVSFRQKQVPAARRLASGAAAAVLGISVAAGLAVFSFQGLSSFLRGEPVVRNLVTSVNVVSAAVKAAVADSDPSAHRERIVIDPSPLIGEAGRQKRGTLMIVVVGETVRLDNWGLAGYERNTTPQLAARGVWSFAETTACGTSTDVSLPCMFSRVGRAEYDRKKILAEESLPALLRRSGANVYWIDNQSGCKGVCDGVGEVKIDRSRVPSLCEGARCLDDALVAGVDAGKFVRYGETTVVFLHQIGNHGPSYYKRYPKSFEVFKPACRDDNLRNCTRQEIVNAYDNAILYTDHFLSGIIDWLGGLEDMDTALLYVSDHGESLGEGNLYLHGAPYFMAPRGQTRVPMALWLSDGMKERIAIDSGCMDRVVRGKASHDMLFSSILGLLDVRSPVYDAKRDFTAPPAATRWPPLRPQGAAMRRENDASAPFKGRRCTKTSL